MGERSAIEWTTHTFNPWWGCIRVSPGCEHCYAETFAKRTGHAVWGPAKTTERRLFGEKHWAEPLRWNAAAEKAGARARVFCASMADVFEDHPALPVEREKLWALIERTPWLDWQILTKRPENVLEMVPLAWGAGFPSNVWLGTSVEDQRRADERIPHLLRAPAAVRFLSCEPLLEPVSLSEHLLWTPVGEVNDETVWAACCGIRWVIIGGESGPGARPFHAEWARDLIRQCRRAGAAPFVKQLGRVVHDRNDRGFDGTEPDAWPVEIEQEDRVEDVYCGREVWQGDPVRIRLRDAKGGDMAEWPEDLRVREMPTPTTANEAP